MGEGTILVPIKLTQNLKLFIHTQNLFTTILHHTLGRILKARLRKPWIYAYHYFGHADGTWLVLYAWLRIEAGMNSQAAFEEAVKRAVGAKKSIDLSDIIKAGTPAEMG